MPKVLLVRNYTPDKQESMLRFAAMLEQGLLEEGWDVDVVGPPIRYGKGHSTLQGKGKWLGYIDKYLLARRTLSHFARQSKPNIVHICDHSNAMYLPLFQAWPRLITCHDLLAVRCWLGEVPGERKSFTGGLQQRWIFSNLRRAPRLVCISQATQNDLQRLAPEASGRSVVIPLGLNQNYHPIERLKAEAILFGSKYLEGLFDRDRCLPFLLHVGNNNWYKNRMGVVAIFRDLLKLAPELEYRLILAGAEPTEELREAARTLAGRVHFFPGPNNAQLEALYSTASCFIFPSLAEGFGWPPIEAQACGCPVAVSDLEPLRGNCGEDAVRFDPKQPIEAARAILPLLTDSAKAEVARQASLCNAKRFAPEVMIATYCDLYRKLLDENSASG